MKPRKLAPYRAKRDFSKTAEPEGRALKRGKKLIYMIQKHAASRLHYDFRLEMDGVLKSWAVTKGPSLDPADKRLAVHVEDHPIEYATFEGTIPQGQYGGGTVMLWDRGHWQPLDDMHAMYKKGHMRFLLEGARLKGEWHLVRMHGKASEKRENWLLIKANDAFATPGQGESAIEEFQTSVATKRGMEQIARGRKVWQSNRKEKSAPGPAERAKPKPPKAKQGKDALPEFLPPQLATLVDHPPQGENWLHEIKFDGYRMLARIDGKKIQLLTRTNKDWTTRFSVIAEALADIPAATALIDGELVALTESGASSFAALQDALSGNDPSALHYYAFDLLHLNGEDLSPRPMTERKERLRALLPEAHPLLHFSEHFAVEGKEMLHQACAMALEGIVSKRADAPYSPGRSGAWLKSKCIRAQEFVIGGFAYQPKHEGQLGSLILGYYKDGALRLAGKVGTGFTRESAETVMKKLKPRVQKENPFGAVPAVYRRGAVWVKPALVAQLEFTEWTPDGRLRHPSFQGLREDKPASEVVRETEKHLSASVARAAPSAAKKVKTAAALTHPDKLLFPDCGVTKRMLGEYYMLVAERMLPHVANRPVSLLRCPEGSGKPCFFQRHGGEGLSSHLRSVDVATKNKHHPYLVLDDAEGLMALVQMGVLEIHVWGARADKPLLPDRIVFDLDPAEDVPWARVKQAALEVRERFAALKLESFLKTTGGKGLHVVVPIARGPGWDKVKQFCRAMAEVMAADAPERYTTNIRKAERTGRIFIDYLRNDLTASAVAPYSTRARPGAPIALPIAWDALKTVKSGAQFTLAGLKALPKNDPWAEMPNIRQRLPKL